MFLTSHFYGPFIGLVLALFLVLLGFPVDGRLLGFAALVCLFWPYSLAVGRVPYLLLSLGSLQHLCLVILWASHGYGGLASPFLLWLAVVPLLAFLYLSPNPRLWALLAAMIAANTAALAWWSIINPPPPVDAAQLQWLALVSALCAAVYVSMMAVHFGRMLNSREAVEKEMARHRQTAWVLDRLASDLRKAASAKIGLLPGIGVRAQPPLTDIADACEMLKRQVTAGEGVAPADVRSVAEATRCLAELVRDVDRYAGLDAAQVRREAVNCDIGALLRKIGSAAEGWPRPVRIDVDALDLPPVATHAPLLEEAVSHSLVHLGQLGPDRPLKLRASSLPSDGARVLVIDMIRDDGRDATAKDHPPVERSATPGSLQLAVASRIVAMLGGKLDGNSGRAGHHVRIELPGGLPA